MYVTGVINKLYVCGLKQAWFNDATACDRIDELFEWFIKNLKKLGSAFWYFIDSHKSWIIVKEDHLATAKQLFEGTGLNFTTEGRRLPETVIAIKPMPESTMKARFKNG